MIRCIIAPLARPLPWPVASHDFSEIFLDVPSARFYPSISYLTMESEIPQLPTSYRSYLKISQRLS